MLLHDGRVLTYGTTTSGQQTGKFDYDVWASGYNASNPGDSPDLPDQFGTLHGKSRDRVGDGQARSTSIGIADVIHLVERDLRNYLLEIGRQPS